MRWIILLLLAACEFSPAPTPIDPPADEVAVHAVLLGGATDARVRVTRTGLRSGTEPVSGAIVTLEGAGVRFPLTESDDCGINEEAWAEEVVDGGCYAASVPGGVRSGAEYLLNVLLPGGREVKGRATIPLPPEIVRPETDLRLVAKPRWSDDLESRDPILFRWKRPPATGIVLTAMVEKLFEGGSRSPGSCEAWLLGSDRTSSAAMIRPDSAARVVYITSCRKTSDSGGTLSIQPDSAQLRLSVVAYDSAYVRYMQVLGYDAIRRNAASAGLEGAVGVFAGAAMADRRVMVVRAPEP